MIKKPRNTILILYLFYKIDDKHFLLFLEQVSTVANFFMNARRRSFDKYQEDPTAEDMNSAMSGMMHHSEMDTRSPLHV